MNNRNNQAVTPSTSISYGLATVLVALGAIGTGVLWLLIAMTYYYSVTTPHDRQQVVSVIFMTTLVIGGLSWFAGMGLSALAWLITVRHPLQPMRRIHLTSRWVLLLNLLGVLLTLVVIILLNPEIIDELRRLFS